MSIKSSAKSNLKGTNTKSPVITSTKSSPTIGSSTHEVQMDKSENIQKSNRCKTIFKPLFLGGYMPIVKCFNINSDPENEDTLMATGSSLEYLTTKSMTEEINSFLRY